MVVFTNSSGGTGGQPFTPPLVEKMKVELAVQDWEQADDTANRVIIAKKCIISVDESIGSSIGVQGFSHVIINISYSFRF